MNAPIQIAPVRKSVVVAAAASLAFDVFTAGMDRWWPKEHNLGTVAVRESVFEPLIGGRVYTKHVDGSEATVGHVIAWEPPRRLVYTWEINSDWHSDPRPQFTSEVQVDFIELDARRTRVELEHRHFERMGSDAGLKMSTSVENGWPEILDLYAQEVGRTLGSS
jgi:uncharacterized protein YndB with AHSA1/START domain